MMIGVLVQNQIGEECDEERSECRTGDYNTYLGPEIRTRLRSGTRTMIWGDLDASPLWSTFRRPNSTTIFLFCVTT